VGRIRLLDERVANRIAAGEVVERPASVLKELIENSLDAGARTVRIVAEGGGKKLLRVEDDGCGMDRDDALLAFERHATSKLKSVEDLEAISTLGFRGEALPAIASVSRLLLATAEQDGLGTEVELRAGKILGVREVNRPRGTSVEVGGLFFNVPARRRFLRSDGTELAQLLRVATDFALARPDLSLRFEHAGRVHLEADGVETPEDRIARLFGNDLARRLLPVRWEAPSARIWGYAGRPSDAVARRDLQHLFVNGRRVRDRTLLHAVAEAYRDKLPAGCYAPLFLFVEVDPADVDVNVHPQKAEVRFRKAAEVHDAVREAIGSAIGTVAAVPTLAELGPAYRPAERPAPFERSVPSGSSLGEPLPSRSVSEDRPLVPPSHPVVVGQLLDSYLIAQDREGLLLLDQHAAHERVLYERYLEEAERGRVVPQRLLLPVEVELASHELALLEEEAGEFGRLGFLVERFGPRTARIEAVPALAAELEAGRLLRELLEEVSRLRKLATGHAHLRRTLVTTAACRAAIQIRTPLTREAMERLVRDLWGCANPTTCPHGRPISFRLPLAEIERAFRRR
jgi:DNA mismatch repair protein MutL